MPHERPVAKFLFDTSIPELQGQSLFPDVAALVTALAQTEFGRMRKRRILWTYAKQALEYTEKGRRPLSDDLRGAIETQLRDVLTASEVPEARVAELVDRFQEAVETDRAVRRPSPFAPEMLFHEMIERSRGAQSHFILTHTPAELLPGRHARQLHEILLHRLGLAEGSARDADVRYLFHFPSAEKGLTFWVRLIDSLPANGAGRLEEVADSRQLIVRVVDAGLCSWPTVVFDPEDPTAASGFTLYYHGQGVGADAVSVAKMDPRSLEVWRETVYTPLRSEKLTDVHYPSVESTPSG